MPLQADSKLAAAAARLAGGQPLPVALSASGYLPVQSSAIHLSGNVSGDELAHTLAAGYCRSLTDPAIVDMGAVQRGREVWLVLGAPVAVPSVDDAAAVSLQILDLVNAERRKGRRCGGRLHSAVGPLTLNRALTVAALAHSQDMAKNREFEHRGHDGSSPAARVSRAGYGGYVVVGENIAAGAMSPAEVTRGWLDSPDHCENIMDPRFTEIGIAYGVNTASEEIVYWTQDFAQPVGADLRRR